MATLPVKIAAYSSGSNRMRAKLMAPVRDCNTTPCGLITCRFALPLASSRNRLGLRPGRRERERAGQQQYPEDSCGRHDLHHIDRSLGPAIGLTAGSTEIGAETREELSIEETAKAGPLPSVPDTDEG